VLRNKELLLGVFEPVKESWCIGVLKNIEPLFGVFRSR